MILAEFVQNKHLKIQEKKFKQATVKYHFIFGSFSASSLLIALDSPLLILYMYDVGHFNRDACLLHTGYMKAYSNISCIFQDLSSCIYVILCVYFCFLISLLKVSCSIYFPYEFFALYLSRSLVL